MDTRARSTRLGSVRVASEPRSRRRSLCWQRCVALVVMWACAACFNLPDFADESLVDRPRILAVVADPPEVNLGDSVSLSVLVAGAEQVTEVRWFACSLLRSFTASTQYGENSDDRGCGDDARELAAGERSTLSGDEVVDLFGDDEGLRAAIGGETLSTGALDVIRLLVGVAFTVEVEVVADGKRLRALKRVLVSMNADPGQNPPPPELRFGKSVLHGVGDAAPYRCEPETGELQVAPGERVTLAPLFEGAQEAWLEEYRVLDARGMLGRRQEQAFYGWFSSVGALERGSTEAPDRTTAWVAPKEPGCAKLWLVVRDGHAGQTACSMQVAVGDAGICH